jgi:hypothetical protein
LGAQGSASAKPTKHELFALVVSGLDETGADAGWKRTFLTEAAAVATSDNAVVQSSAASDGKVTITHNDTQGHRRLLESKYCAPALRLAVMCSTFCSAYTRAPFAARSTGSSFVPR